MTPLTASWYLRWIGFHREATAANAEAVNSLLAIEEIVLDVWQATEEELMQVTRRLVGSRRTPKFANEHADSVGTELVVLRSERDRAGYMLSVPTGPGDCPERCTRGILIAPLPVLVLEGRTGRELARQTIVVLCDVCQTGKAEIVAQDRVEKLAAPTKEEAWKKKKLMTLSKYLERTKGQDGVGILRQYEAEVLQEMRKERGESLKPFPVIAATLAGGFRVPYKERPRGPESLDD